MLFHVKIRIKTKSFIIDEQNKAEKQAELVSASVWINRSLSLEPVINLSYKKPSSRSLRLLIEEQHREILTSITSLI